ncbi:MAG: rhodanese-like domain-containing protein, partial [Acidimicrobiales bacterium]|nr:rhodanese-like domain-containing protein [Acidimicrobiales bacterium]
TATELAERRDALGDELQFIDVRNAGEVHANPVDGARNIPLARLRGELDGLDRDRPVVAVCASGGRSAIAASLLTSEGFADVSDVLGGAVALGAAGACSVSA